MTTMKRISIRLLLIGTLSASLSLHLVSRLYGQNQTSGTNSDFQITWTDRGISQYELGLSAGGVLPQGDGAALILLPMPGDQMMPKTPAEWAKFGNSMKGFFQAKIAAARAAGFSRVEVLTQQNIGKAGYFDWGQQNDVTDFTNQIGHALLTAKTDLQG